MRSGQNSSSATTRITCCLKLNLLQYWRDQVKLPEREFPEPFSLKDPVIDFAGLAQAMGVPGLKVEKPEQIGPAIQQMLATEGPFLIDLIITTRCLANR